LDGVIEGPLCIKQLNETNAARLSADIRSFCHVRSSNNDSAAALVPMKNALGASYSSTGNRSDWIGPSPGIANAVRCEASCRAQSASGDLMPMASMSCRTSGRSKMVR